jgi:hypothetical protein
LVVLAPKVPQALESPYSALIALRTSIPVVAKVTSPIKFPVEGMIQTAPPN